MGRINAVKRGKSYDTSMGATPLEGLVMGTRSGNIYPSILNIMSKTLNKSAQEIENILNKKSGILGISGISNDLRDIWDEIKNNNLRAKLAIEISAYRKKYIGAYLAALNFKVDAIVFTAGIGELDYRLREKILLGFENIGIELDSEKNKLAQSGHLEPTISINKSKIKIMIIPTHEEMIIIEDTYELISEEDETTQKEKNFAYDINNYNLEYELKANPELEKIKANKN